MTIAEEMLQHVFADVVIVAISVAVFVVDDDDVFEFAEFRIVQSVATA